MKDYVKNKELPYTYWDINSSYGWQCQKNCLLMVQFNKDFIEIYNEDNDEKYFLEVDVQYPEKFSQFP